MAGKVVPLRRDESQGLLVELAARLQADEVTDLVVMARMKDKTTVRKWFGHESSFRCLGMTTYLHHMICEYISGHSEEI